MKKLLLPAVLISFIFLAGCGFTYDRGSGVIAEEVREVGSFSTVEVNGAFYVEIRNGKEPEVKVVADDNLIRKVITEVRGNRLIIQYAKKHASHPKIKVLVSAENVEAVNSSGASTIRIANVRSEIFNINLSGAGKINVWGRTKDFNLDVSGAGKISAENLKAETVRIQLSGAAKADVYAAEKLYADISGVGSVDYYGNPKVVKKNISGIGSISQK